MPLRDQSRHLHLPKGQPQAGRTPAQALDDGPALVERVITRLGIDIQVDVGRVSTAAPEVRDPHSVTALTRGSAWKRPAMRRASPQGFVFKLGARHGTSE